MLRVMHFEIHAKDLPRARTFYSAICGWEFTSWGGPMEYWLIKTGEDGAPGIIGGMLKRQCAIDGQAVIVYVCTVGVEDVEETQAAVEAAGGMVAVPKMAIPGMGRLAYFKDTEGNIYASMQPDPATT